MLRELPFYDHINISRKERAFKRYDETYDIEIVNNKNLTNSLVLNKSAIKDLSSNLLREKREFKYLLSTGIILKKHDNENKHKYSTAYFNSQVKTVINQRYHLNDSF